MEKKNGLLQLIKSEFDFSFIFSLLVLTVICLNTINREYLDMPLHIEITLTYLAIALFFILLIVNIKNIKLTMHHILLFCYMFICVLSTKKYIGEYDTFSENILSYILCMVSALYFSLPYKEYSLERKVKIRIFKFIILLVILIIDIFGIIVGVQEGICIHYNILGAFNFVGVLCAFSLIDKENNLVFNIFYLLSSLLFIFVAYSSTSRASLLAILIFIGLYIIAKIYQRIKNKLLFIIALIVFVFLSLFVLYLFRDTILSFITRDIDSDILNDNPFLILSGRWYLWTDRLMLAIKDNFLFGLGIKTYSLVSLGNLDFIRTVIENVVYLHNIIFDAFYSSGIIGFIYFILSIIFFMIYIIKGYAKNKRTIIIPLIVLASLFIYFLFDTYFIWEYRFPNLLFFLEIGYICNEVSGYE